MILFGASGHCKVIIDLLFLNNFKVDKIFDDNPQVGEIFNIPVFKTIKILENQKAIISIGSNSIRKKIAELYHLDYISAFHPSAVISNFAKIGKGTVLMANCSVNAAAIVGNHCIINTNAVVEHDCKVSDFVHIAPNACVAGNAQIGEGSHIGIGAIIKQETKIGKWCIIGAGAVVLGDMPDFSMAVGNPAKITKICNEI